MSTFTVPVFSARSNNRDQQVDILPVPAQPGDIRINAVDPLFIPRLVVDLPEDEGVFGGINLSMTEDKHDDGSKGVSAYVLPWLLMDIGDKYEVWARYPSDNTPIKLAGGDVQPSQLNQIIPVRLPDHLLTDGICELYVMITRISGNQEESPRLSVLVKKTLPGGPDPDPEAPFHQNLGLPQVNQDILKNGVTQDILARGVEVTVLPYLNMRKNSIVMLHWGSVKLKQRVAEDQVNKPITFLVSKATIEQAGDAENLMVNYGLMDVVENNSADNSPPLYLIVNTQLELLESPIVDQADDNGIVNLKELNGADVRVIVSSRLVTFTPQDKVTFYWIGRAPDGREVRHEEAWIPQSNTRTHDFFVPYALIHLIAHGAAVVFYTLTRAGVIRNSRKVNITIEGLPFQHPAPEVPQAPGDLLPAGAPSAEVKVPKITGAQAGDVVRVFWMGTKADGTLHDYIGQRTLSDELVGQDIFFGIERKDFEPLIGGTVKVYYILYRDGTTPMISDTLGLFVGVAITELPAPTVPTAPGGMLIPEDVPNGTIAVIEPYSNMRALDHIKFWIVGNIPAMSWFDTLILGLESVGKPVEFPISKDVIARNIGASVELVYTVTNPVDHQRRISSRLKLTIRAPIPVPGISSVRDASNAVIPINGSTYSPTVTLSGPRGANSPVEILDNGTVIATVPAGAQKIWTSQPLPMDTGSHRFTVRTPGSTQESAPWAITVLLMRPAAINALIDGNNVSIGNGGATFSTTATLRGTATPNEQVQILLNGTVRQTVPVDANGNWTYTISPLAVFGHRFLARPVPADRPDSNAWVLNVRSEWTDINTLFQNHSYDGWQLHNAARCGSIRGWQGRLMFCNFTDFGAPTGFAGTIFYRDLTFLPGTYQFRVNATHIAEGGPNPNLLNPVLSLTESGQDLRADRALPKDGRFYDIILNLTVPTRQTRRLYVNNYQDGSNGNDFVISQISVIRTSGGGGGILTAPEEFNELPPYEGPLPTIDMPQRKK